ncbi:MAG: choice-of-anchor D domain-containing protein [Candidatus Kapaibacterium sp.]
MQRSFFICLLLFCASQLPAQNLSVFNLDATNFPTLKAKFYAFDANGNQLNPPASEISITENGTSRNVSAVNCPVAAPPRQLSSVLVMDVSGSMADGSGSSPNIDIAKAAATFWISNVPLGESECAITSFDDANYFNQDYTTNRTKLANAIAGLHPQNGTNYDAAFLLPMSSGLEVTKLAKHQKVIVFLSDGLPNFEPQTSAIIAEAQKQNCLIFGVTVGLPCPQCLQDISTQTGGKWFENITTQAQIEEVYQEILHQAQGGSPCEITWQSDVSCTSDARNIEFDWNSNGNYKAYGTYALPATAVAGLQITPPSLYIRSKPVGVKFDTIVTITANNSAFSVTNIASSNPSYDINPKSFALAAGKSQTLTVSYTPPDSSYTWTRFDIATDLCPQTYYASASYPGHKPNIPTLRLTQPNGGEFIVVGADTVITWKGMPLTDTVKLEYSTDGGSSWNLISDRATGGRYGWHVPKTVSDRCLVRVEQGLSGWARQGGSKAVTDTNRTSARDEHITIDNLGNIYVIGDFVGELNFGGIILKSKGNGFSSIYLTKYRPDGSVEWAKRLGGDGEDEAEGLVIDANGDICILTQFSYCAGCWPQKVITDIDGIIIEDSTEYYSSCIAKFHPNGTVVWAKKIASAHGFDVEAYGIALDNRGSIYVTGGFGDTAYFGSTILIGSTEDVFLAKYDMNGDNIWAKQCIGYDSYGRGIVIDTMGNIYVNGDFFDTVTFGSFKIYSAGDYDIFIAKFFPDGTIDWVKRGGGTRLDYTNTEDIAIDEAGNLYLTLAFLNDADLDGTYLKGVTGNFFTYFFVKFHSDGILEWIKQAPDQSAFDAIFINPNNQKIYMSGSFFGIDSFSGISLDTSNNKTFFIARLDLNGNFEWIKSSNVSGTAIRGDQSENIFLTGEFSDRGIFDHDTLNALPSPFHDMFLWKLATLTLQSDTSDATFSIVMPQALSEDIDMGKVLVNSAKDSVIQKFIRNSGSYPFRVDSISFTGADASQFSLVSGIPPFDLPAGGAHLVEFDFHPSSAEAKSAQIKIFTQADTLYQNITGEGIAPELGTTGSFIDFGKVMIGGHVDSTIAAIENHGNVAIKFSASFQLGPDTTEFSILSGDGPFTLAPGASRNLTLRFAPRLIGRTSGRIGFTNNGTNSPAIINLFGQGIGGLLRIPNDSGYGGDHKNLPLILENEPLASVQTVATNFRARIAYNKIVLNASGGNVQAGNTFDTLTITNSLGSSDTLAMIPFLALPGTTATSPVRIVDFVWLNGAGQPSNHDVETESGIFHLLGAVKPQEYDWASDIVEIYPNPTSGTFHFEVTSAENVSTQIALVNILGQRVALIYDGDLSRGAHEFDFATHNLPTGSYFLTLKTPSVLKMRKVDVFR